MVSSPSLENPVQQIKDTAQIVDIVGECVVLKRVGANLKGLCPFHAEKTPSFMVNPERQTFHCFGCGEGGDVFSFMMKYHHLTFPEAMKELAQRYHIILPESKLAIGDQDRAKKRQMLFAINEKAAKVYHDFLLKAQAASRARTYLEERGVSARAINEFRLGYAPDSWNFLFEEFSRSGIASAAAEEAGLLVRKEKGGYYDRFRKRILFPICDLRGKIAGFGGRILGEGEPKYLNSPETPVYNKSRILFGLYHHKENIRLKKRAVIVEGNFDLLSLNIHDVKYAIAPLGTALTPAQVRLIKGYTDEVILLFDGDKAGLKAAMRAVPIFLTEQVQARVATLPPGHDPDSFVREYGREGLEKYLDQSMPLPEFVFDRLVEKYGLTLEGKGRILKELQPLVESMGTNPIQRSVLVSQFGERLDLDPRQVLEGFQEAGRLGRGTEQRVDFHDKPTGKQALVLPQKQKQLLEFLIIYPEFLQQFIDGGIEECIVASSAKIILDHLKEIHSSGSRALKPETLLDILPEGPERTFVSSLLISPRVYEDDESEALLQKMAEEQLAWLKKVRFEKDLKRLNRKIKDAEEAGDAELLLELSTQKIALNKTIKASLSGEES